MDWYLKAMKLYATFEGRAQRSEYWFFTLFFMIGYIAFIIIDVLIGTIDTESGLGLLSGIFLFAHIVPSIAVTVRRLHDIGKSGWWFLLFIIPIIALIAIVFMLMDSKEDNKYGPNPKNITA